MQIWNGKTLLLCALLATHCATAAEWSGHIGLETRLFNHAPLDPQQERHSASISFSPEYYHGWDHGRSSLTFRPFVRVDSADDERTHADIRELLYLSNHGRWEFKAGIGKVFWGVTESQHLVDIINQTDLIESLDGEEKLGQPMLVLTAIRNWGTVDLYVLPGFREIITPGINGRLRTLPYIDHDQAGYTSDDGKDHIDYAIRSLHTLGDWEIGLHHFYGTARTPTLSLGTDGTGNPVLIPTYNLLHQTGIDAQYITDGWLWKLEAVHRRVAGRSYNATTGGFEYTLYGILDTQYDMGIISEYLYDSRGDTGASFFEDDLMVGARLNFNDTQSSEILFGIIIDRDHHERIYSLEASTRLNSHWSLNVEARVFSGIDSSSKLGSFRRDDFLQIELLYYF